MLEDTARIPKLFAWHQDGKLLVDGQAAPGKFAHKADVTFASENGTILHQTVGTAFAVARIYSCIWADVLYVGELHKSGLYYIPQSWPSDGEIQQAVRDYLKPKTNP